MKNLSILILLFIAVLLIIWKGDTIAAKSPIKLEKKSTEILPKVPFLGRIELLNGCGIDGAAREVQTFLRAKGFDIKHIGNASQTNNEITLVISRLKDTTMASKVASALKTPNMYYTFNGDTLYDVTVIIGSDYKERIQ